MIDSHCHLDGQYFGADRAEVLARARELGVTAFVSVGVGRGLDVAAMSEADWDELAVLARRPRVVGVGETGLDYHYDHSPRDVQIAAYHRFAALARTAGLPLVSHVRDAHVDAAEVLRTENVGAAGVIHCFTGGVDEARVYLDLGHCLSFSGILTFKNADAIRAAAAFAPLDRILIETDSPYLAPIPHRGKRNEPAFVVETLKVLAGLRNISVADVDAATTTNARRLFRLPAA